MTGTLGGSGGSSHPGEGLSSVLGAPAEPWSSWMCSCRRSFCPASATRGACSVTCSQKRCSQCRRSWTAGRSQLIAAASPVSHVSGSNARSRLLAVGWRGLGMEDCTSVRTHSWSIAGRWPQVRARMAAGKPGLQEWPIRGQDTLSDWKLLSVTHPMWSVRTGRARAAW